MKDEDFAVAFTGLADLEADSLQLATRIFNRRCQPPPWDFRDEPANQRFLENLRGLGVEPTSWIDEAPVFEEDLGPLGSVRITIERDPLALLHMGRWFGTCLSPDSFNYFSVFTNIADVNKQVVYARDRKGRVVGRTLLGLTDQGAIVTFHAYSHGDHDQFSQVMARYVLELSQRMHSPIVAKGRISSLVGPRWYDDGPEDLAYEVPELEEGSSFRRRLRTMDPEELLPAIEEAVPHPGIRRIQFPKILNLEEFDLRPELAVGLGSLARKPDLPTQVAQRIVSLLLAAGMPSEARLWTGVLEREIRAEELWDFDCGSKPLELLFAIDPALGLRALRTKRPMRSWPDPQDSYHRNYFAVAAEAYMKLGRTRRAREVVERAEALYGRDTKEVREARRILTRYGTTPPMAAVDPNSAGAGA